MAFVHATNANGMRHEANRDESVKPKSRGPPITTEGAISRQLAKSNHGQEGGARQSPGERMEDHKLRRVRKDFDEG